LAELGTGLGLFSVGEAVALPDALAEPEALALAEELALALGELEWLGRPVALADGKVSVGW
jgi:hypothetical protein